MAKGRFRSLDQLLPGALDALAEKAAAGGALGPAWVQSVGGSIANVSRPRSLVGGTLQVEVDGEAWVKELSARAPQLLARLGQTLGGRVKKLVFTLSGR